MLPYFPKGQIFGIKLHSLNPPIFTSLNPGKECECILTAIFLAARLIPSSYAVGTQPMNNALDWRSDNYLSIFCCHD